MAVPGPPRIVTTPAPPDTRQDRPAAGEKMSIPVRARSFESAQCIWSRAARHAKVGRGLGR